MALDFNENDYLIKKWRQNVVKIADILRKLHKTSFLDLKINLVPPLYGFNNGFDSFSILV